MTGQAITVEVRYFASLRERAGRGQETLRTTAPTAAALYEELCRRHGFELTPLHLRVVLNDAFVPWDSSLSDGDTVVFIPPVAGG